MNLLKKFSTYFLLNGINIIITLVVTSLILREYNLDDFSRYSKILLYSGYLVPILTFSMPTWLNNNFNRYDKQLPGVLVLCILFLNSIIWIPIVVYLFFEGADAYTLFVLSLFCFSTVVFNIIISFLQFGNFLRIYVFSQSIFLLANLLTIVVVLMEVRVEARIVILSIGQLAALLYLAIISKFNFSKDFIPDFKKMMHWGLKLLPHSFLAGLLITGDKLIIENNLSEEIFGQYMILASLLSPFAVAATLINQGVKPEVFHALEEKDTINYRYLMRTHIGLTLLLGFFFICFSYFLIFYLNFDQGQYNLGPSIIVISSLIVTALSMYYPYSNTLLFYEKTTELSMGTYIMTSCLIFIYLASKYYNFEIFNVLVMVLLSAFLYVIYYQIAEIRVLKKINVNR